MCVLFLNNMDYDDEMRRVVCVCVCVWFSLVAPRDIMHANVSLLGKRELRHVWNRRRRGDE